MHLGIYIADLSTYDINPSLAIPKQEFVIFYGNLCEFVIFYEFLGGYSISDIDKRHYKSQERKSKKHFGWQMVDSIEEYV